MLPVAILAGGLATRLHPTTLTIPKSLIKVAGKPFIFHQLKNLREQGITDIVLCTGHLGEMIKSYVGDGSKFDLKILYSSDGRKLLGTGGAIKKALPLLGNQFFILYGDTYLPIKFDSIEQSYLSNNFSYLMTVLKNDGMWDQSNAFFVNDRLIEYNKKNPTSKMRYIDYGLSIVSKNIFDKYSEDTFFDLSDIFHYLSKQRQLVGLEVFKRFYEIGTPNSLKETEGFLSNLNIRRK